MKMPIVLESILHERSTTVYINADKSWLVPQLGPIVEGETNDSHYYEVKEPAVNVRDKLKSLGYRVVAMTSEKGFCRWTLDN